MIDPNDPPRGSMYLYDAITPPAKDGTYKINIASTVSYPDEDSHTLDLDRFIDIVGPRFSIQPTDVANVYPPRNSVGAFHDAIPQIVIKRRTLPWERAIGKLAPAAHAPQDPLPPNGDVPWVALLLFEEGEYTLYENLPLEQVVPPDVFQRVGRPANILCDAVEADAGLVDSIMPAREELQLLAHVRQVNVEDRELNADTSDGFFSVVISNRLPTPGVKHRACLVSLEERMDLVKPDPPPFTYGRNLNEVLGGVVADREMLIAPAGGAAPATSFTSTVRDPFITASAAVPRNILFRNRVRLVVLHTWQFTCQVGGTFFELMQALDVGLIGKTKDPGHPPLTDTGHLRLPLQDRAGAPEVTWYRGPLVPWELTRDPLVYHCADQARRATPETGAEDISYAAAFEVGRLLAAADARLAQELMRWRRESYRQAARADGLVAVQKAINIALPADLAERLHTVLTPLVSAAAIEKVVNNAGPIADRLGLDKAAKTVGFDPHSLGRAWGLVSPLQGAQILGGDPGTLGSPVQVQPKTPRHETTLEEVAANLRSLDYLHSARAKILENAAVKLKGGSQ